MNIGNWTIKTAFNHPPIPDRRFDWSAWCDGLEDWRVGNGTTELAAINDLNLLLNESGQGEEFLLSAEASRVAEAVKSLLAQLNVERQANEALAAARQHLQADYDVLLKDRTAMWAAISQDSVDAYVSAFDWSADTTDWVKTMVIGNVRGFVSHLRRLIAVGKEPHAAAQRDVALITELKRQLEGERTNKMAARERWTECQARLGMLEGLARNKTGIRQETEDNIEHMAAVIAELVEALRKCARWMETYSPALCSDSLASARAALAAAEGK